MDLTDDEVEEILSAYTPWLRARAKYFNAGLVDDLVQEAMIGMWKTLKTYTFLDADHLDAIMKRQATWRMRTSVSKDTWTGTKKYWGARRIEMSSTLFSPEAMMAADLKIPTIPDPSDSTDFSMYAEEIEAAINKVLKSRPAEFLKMRYVERMKPSEINRELGLSPGYYPLTKEHMDKLADELSHLRSMVMIDE